MYTIMIVDCDRIFREKIIRELEWGSLGFEVIGEAANGEMAMEMARELEPDLVLTEILMPDMSGIELTRKLRALRPNTQIALFSECEDFAYAQQAIQYNIVDYIVKPIEVEALQERMRTIKSRMDAYFFAFTRKYTSKSPIHKADFMLPLLLDYVTEQGKEESQLLEEAIACGLLRDSNVENLKFSVIITQIEDPSGGGITERGSVDAVDMILKKYVRYVSCYLNGKIVSVVTGTQYGLNKYLPIFAEELIQNVERITGAVCQIRMSCLVEQLSQCRQAYQEALNVARCEEIPDESKCYTEKEQKALHYNYEEYQMSLNRMKAILRTGTWEELEGYFKQVEHEYLDGKCELSLTGFLLSQMIHAIYDAVYEDAGKLGVERIQETYPLWKLKQTDLLLEQFYKVRDMGVMAWHILNEQKKNSKQIICERAMNAVWTRWNEQDLSVMKVSREIGVTPNYLSALIKNTQGQTFMELLTEKRMKKARDLLEHTSLKVRDVAEQSGYRDQYYFSNCFKKIHGCSPNEYRNRQKSEEKLQKTL